MHDIVHEKALYININEINDDNVAKAKNHKFRLLAAKMHIHVFSICPISYPQFKAIINICSAGWHATELYMVI